MKELYTTEDNLIIVQGWPGLARLNKDQQLFAKDSPIDLQLMKLFIIEQQMDEVATKLGSSPTREDYSKLTEQERGLPNEMYTQMTLLSRFEKELDYITKANVPSFFHDKRLLILSVKMDGSTVKVNIV